MLKAKTFQPVAVLNQKLKGLDVFESNDEIAAAAPQASASPPPQDPDLYVTRTHWQKQSGGDVCRAGGCGRPLGAVNGSVNCRKCGRLFCEMHSMYQIKLSRSAEHEPVRGYWCRVCEDCYKAREGYLDTTGVSQDLTGDFLAMRRKNVDRVFLEVTRLEKRLTKVGSTVPHYHSQCLLTSESSSQQHSPPQ
jgi:rabenosyn-5